MHVFKLEIPPPLLITDLASQESPCATTHQLWHVTESAVYMFICRLGRVKFIDIYYLKIEIENRILTNSYTVLYGLPEQAVGRA